MLGKIKIKVSEKEEIACGFFSREEAANYIVEGTRHLHSTTLGEREPEVQRTQKLILGEEDQGYSWEIDENVKTVLVEESGERSKKIREVVTELGLETRSYLLDKIQTVLEELVSNAIYHSYRDDQGIRKYDRGKNAILTEDEKVKIRYANNPNGVFLEVTDVAGKLTFETVKRCLERCYAKGSDQVESKLSGAGLGLYIIFETVTHLKFAVTKDKRTVVSCWIADKRPHDRDRFSFNFFEKE